MQGGRMAAHAAFHASIKWGLSMSRFMPHSLALAIFIAVAPVSSALAHCFVGGRFFPANLVGDDPCVADEMSIPTVSIFKNGDDPSALQTDFAAEYSKRI